MGKTFADIYHEYRQAESDFEDKLLSLGVPDWSTIGADDYDSSIELYEVPNDVTLTIEVLQFLSENGFDRCYLNHKNGWQTHYSDMPKNPKGWRVKYIRGDRGTKEILVEEFLPNWPKHWFDLGYVKIVEPDPNDAKETL
jgi:hypothetical protein